MKKMACWQRPNSAALRHLYDRHIGDDPKQQAIYEERLANAQVARALYDLRTAAGLTQAALARRVGTTPSVISRLEDADYRGHSLAMLWRIAAALDRRIEIRFLPRRPKKAAARPLARLSAKRTTGARKSASRA